MRFFGVRQAQQPAWRKATFCASGECVEITKRNEKIILRDSAKRRGHVHYSTEEWRAFVRGVKAGEFDDLGA